jgi:dTMP kinase
VRDPGGTPLGERLRDVLKDPAAAIGAHAEALLFAAARAEAVEQVIRPALEDGRVVISDRFVDSSLAYQGEARGLGADAVRRLNDWATGGLVPDITFLLALPAEAAAARGGQADRFENEGSDLQRRVHEAYEQMAAAEPERWRRLDADRDPAELHAEVLAVVNGVPA